MDTQFPVATEEREQSAGSLRTIQWLPLRSALFEHVGQADRRGMQPHVKRERDGKPWQGARGGARCRARFLTRRAGPLITANRTRVITVPGAHFSRGTYPLLQMASSQPSITALNRQN